ncbi:MAG: prephenate dehydrogenase/arogenate dehydrogenase family protein [Proteobacteria bacterium]|nr:prephenate dehydrogenase/arogenate dehydrogenase family protein [Pseudomonadota bacterium]
MTECREIHFSKVAIIGVGLIGGSLAISMRDKGLAEEFIGIGRGAANLEKAIELGVVDSFTHDIAEGVSDADLVVVAVPVVSSLSVIKSALCAMKKGAILTDAGSVKGALIDEIEGEIPEGVNVVWGHPIAGTEFSGVEAAFSTLYEDKTCIITPTDNTPAPALEAITYLWKTVGSSVILMDAKSHDEILAAVSHLPHIAAFSLVNAIADLEETRGNILEYSAGGFRDFTRIASSSPKMWADISAMNRDALLEVIESFEKSLATIKTKIEEKDFDSLEETFKRAKDTRDSLL